jgi:hypothetical protein
MTSPLIEAVARALCKQSFPDYPTAYVDTMYREHVDAYQRSARIVLEAIEASGTHVLMPTTITQDMREAVRSAGGTEAVAWANAAYPELLSARPKVGEP